MSRICAPDLSCRVDTFSGGRRLSAEIQALPALREHDPREAGEEQEIIASFDHRIPEFYDDGDRKKGYILGKSRQGVEMKFPLITISIAIVTNERRTLSSPLETSEIAAELKEYAKTIPKSVFVIDKPRNV